MTTQDDIGTVIEEASQSKTYTLRTDDTVTLSKNQAWLEHTITDCPTGARVEQLRLYDGESSDAKAVIQQEYTPQGNLLVDARTTSFPESIYEQLPAELRHFRSRNND